MLASILDWLTGHGITRIRLLAFVSVAAFVMSGLTWISTFVHQRKRLSVFLLEYFQEPTRLNLMLSIENKSRLPISISRISILLDGKEYLCSYRSIKVLEFAATEKGVRKVTESHFSLPFPIPIFSLGAVGGYLTFPDFPRISENPPTPLTLRVYTNRGRPKRMKPLSGYRHLRRTDMYEIWSSLCPSFYEIEK